MYRIGLLILAVFLIGLGVALPYIPHVPEFLGTILLVFGAIVFVIWLIYLVLAYLPNR